LATALLGSVVAVATPAAAAGDFPLASCKGWNGTIVERSGVNTSNATMKGIITKADIQEYCERDPGGETKAYGGKLTTTQCVEKYLRTEGRVQMSARANCGARTVEYQYGQNRPTRLKLPSDDTSCASGAPPMMAQFKMLCPTAAKRLGIE
jgi:hypothetical protein